MASKASVLALFLILNTLLFTLTSACGDRCPKPTPTPSPPSGGKCPMDVLKLAVCADVLSGLINISIGEPPKVPCCPLLSDLLDLEAAVCLCTAIKANLLGIVLDIPVDLSLLLNYCGKNVPTGFQCP